MDVFQSVPNSAEFLYQVPEADLESGRAIPKCIGGGNLSGRQLPDMQGTHAARKENCLWPRVSSRLSQNVASASTDLSIMSVCISNIFRIKNYKTNFYGWGVNAEVSSP